MEKYIWEGRELFRLGSLPKKGIFMSCRANAYVETGKALYLSALEAVLNGYDVIYIPASFGGDCIEKGVLDAGGRLYQIYPYTADIERENISRALKSNGGVIALSESTFSLSNLNIAKCIASSLACSIVVGEDSSYYFKRLCYIDYALDLGKEIAVLRPALISPSIQSLIKEGGAVISTFSDFLLSPGAISYKSEKGRYSILGENFDIIYLDERA